MYFTSGQDRAFERLMQEKPGFDHYDGGGANAPEDCGSCHFYRPDWKYQYCVYAECPYQPGKLTALAAVKFTVKGADDDMAVFRVEKNKGYTVMSNHHLRNKALSLKAKGLLSQMLSLPEDWDYTLKGLSLINRESIDAIRTAVWELERAGYIRREQGRDAKGKMADMVYTIYEQPVLDKPVLENPVLENPTSDNPTSDNPASGNPTQLNKEIQRTNLPRKEKLNTDGSRDIPAEQYFDGSPDRALGSFLRYEFQPRDPAVLQEALQQEQRGREQARPGDFKAHITALHDSRIETEAQRIVDKLKDLSAPNSPNKTHFMVEISPHFDALASTKDNDRLFAMLPYKSLCFTGIKDRHGVYAMIGKDERRDVSIRRPRPSIRKQLTDSKQAASPKKAAARTKKKELEV